MQRKLSMSYDEILLSSWMEHIVSSEDGRFPLFKKSPPRIKGENTVLFWQKLVCSYLHMYYFVI